MLGNFKSLAFLIREVDTMNAWITIIIIPIFIALFSNVISTPEVEYKKSCLSQILSYEEILNEYIKKLMAENIGKIDTIFWCSQIIDTIDTIMKIYLQDRSVGSNCTIINNLCNVKEQIIHIIESYENNQIYFENIKKLKSSIKNFYIELDVEYKKYKAWRPLISSRGKAILLLVFMIISTLACRIAYIRTNDEYINEYAIGIIMVISGCIYVIAIILIHLAYYISNKLKKRHK